MSFINPNASFWMWVRMKSMIFTFKNSVNSAMGLFWTMVGGQERLLILPNGVWNASTEQREEMQSLIKRAPRLTLLFNQVVDISEDWIFKWSVLSLRHTLSDLGSQSSLCEMVNVFSSWRTLLVSTIHPPIWKRDESTFSLLISSHGASLQTICTFRNDTTIQPYKGHRSDPVPRRWWEG